MVSYDHEQAHTGLVQRVYRSTQVSATYEVSMRRMSRNVTTTSAADSTFQELVLTPLRFATSKFALKAYITTILFTIAGFVLFGLAVTAYTLFYWSYIPRIGFERTIHLQFDASQPAQIDGSPVIQQSQITPHGTVALNPDIVSQQQYDVSIELTLPRTPTNTALGNFMLDVRLYAPNSDRPASYLGDLHTTTTTTSSQLLAHARRPAILTYLSREVDLVTRATQLHWYLLGWRREEEILVVPVFEKIEFTRGRKNLPSILRLELQVPFAPHSTDSNNYNVRTLQVYDAKVTFRARFRGLRYLMYNHRVASAAVFVTGFWLTEIIATAATWAVLSLVIFGSRDHSSRATGSSKGDTFADGTSGDVKVKDELEMSDTERLFPTFDRGSTPMRYTAAAAGIKIEEDDEDDDAIGSGGVVSGEDGSGSASGTTALLRGGVTTTAEADDEDDEDADFVLDEADKWRDSGIGTSMDSSGGGPGRLGSIRRRRSRN